MIERIVDAPWAFIATVVGLVLLNVAAGIRLRHDRKLQRRAPVDRRSKPRTEPDRRWSAKRLTR